VASPYTLNLWRAAFRNLRRAAGCPALIDNFAVSERLAGFLQ
jgi:hypothetical protein